MAGHGRRRHKGGHHEEEHENEERWLVSFADMMTLLFCLFMVLFAISSVNTSKFEALQKSLQDAFSGAVLSGGKAVMASGSSDGTQKAAPQPPLPSLRPLTAMNDTSAQSSAEREAKARQEEQDFRALKRRVDNLAKDAAGLKDAQQSATKTAYQQWIEGAAQRKKDRDATVAAMPDKAAAARLRAELEKTEREVTENLKQRDAQDAENNRAFRALDPTAKHRERLAAMSPEERNAPAWAVAMTSEPVPPNAPGAKRVVRVNPAFLRARGSPARPLAILVRFREPELGVEHAQTQLYREFDWAALKKLLDQ